MGHTRSKRLARLLLLIACLGLAGCQDDLYSNLTESEANQMLSVLMAHGISVGKTQKGKEGYTIAVENRDMLRAIALLNDSGLPKNNRESVGKVFQKSGIMSSPFEERVRYIYALGEDVAQTLSQIDGVVTARVHLVMPDAPQLGQAVKPSSAAVFIKHQSGTDLDFLVPQIRRLVSSSIEGLDYQSVTVVLTEAKASQQDVGAVMVSTVDVLPGVAVRDTDVGRFWQIAYAMLISLGLLAISTIVFVYLYLQSRGVFQGRGRRVSTETLVEPS